MKKYIYNFLVNKHNGIRIRYHRFHDNTSGIGVVISWFYLLWLNFAYYVLFCRFLGKEPSCEIYEKKKLPIHISETSLYDLEHDSAEDYVKKLITYDVVSFDVFDTLILRPLSAPIDVFYYIGEKLGIADYKNIRSWAEFDARFKHKNQYGNMEVSLQEIYDNLHQDIGIDPMSSMQLEIDTELDLCQANPFMLAVWKKLVEANKTIIIVSDMYLPADVIQAMLHKNGFIGFEKIYVSCEYGKSKAKGDLYSVVRNEYKFKKIIHVGDNPRSDNKNAVRAGLDVYPYKNVNVYMNMYRPFDMSYMIGSGYRGVVSNHLYNGLNTFSVEYEYGYLYGGLFVLGYCNFIHNYCQNNNIDKLLFLSRDGDILKQVYDKVFPNENTEYAYWSRKAATKLMARYDKHDYFRRFIYHKVNQDYSLQEILKSMELDSLIDELDDWKDIYDKWVKEPGIDLSKIKYIELKAEDKLTDKNGFMLRRFIEAKWDKVMSIYAQQDEAAKSYYRSIVDGAKKAIAVDIGWAGSGALSLMKLFEAWNIDCTLTGIIAGTNTMYNAEPDATEPFLQSGKLVTYLYSQAHNRDLLKKHDPNRDYNVFWELLLSSPTPQFVGFYSDGLAFGKYDENLEGIRDVQRGIIDFANQYTTCFKDYPYMLNISGRDAYAPMLAAASHNEKYLKFIKKKFDLNINVE